MTSRSFVLALLLPLLGLQPMRAQQPGQLTPEVLQQLLKRFPGADANKDGTLTVEEAVAYREKMGGGQGARGQRPALPTPTHANVPYGPHERNVLDFWEAKSSAPAPLLVYIHGGGFVAGDKALVAPGVILAMTDAGISFASINYRYTTQAPYPAPMLDGARAIQFLRSKAAEWKIDPKRIGAFGGSAGAGISMWAGFHDDLANPASSDPVERQSSRLLCVGSMGGQCSYDPLQIREWLGGSAWRHSAFKPFYALVCEARRFDSAASRRDGVRGAAQAFQLVRQGEDRLMPGRLIPQTLRRYSICRSRRRAWPPKQ
jgi:acetyl esterase